MKNIGKIVQVIGPVVDILFADGHLPALLTAIEIDNVNSHEKLVVEVAQHIGDDRVRTIAMGSTDGLVRGMDADVYKRQQLWQVPLNWMRMRKSVFQKCLNRK